MRAFLVVAAALAALFAGCLEGQDPVEEPVRGHSGQFQTQAVDGRYSALKPLGQELQEEGGSTALEVSGWKFVTVTLDANIEVDLVLLPPGCASSADACAVRFAPANDVTQGSWMLDAMEAGTWTVVVEADPGDYTMVDGLYTVGFEYLEA